MDQRGFRSRRAAYRWPAGQQGGVPQGVGNRSEEHTSELQSHLNLVCRLLLEKKKKTKRPNPRRRAQTSRFATWRLCVALSSSVECSRLPRSAAATHSDVDRGNKSWPGRIQGC